MTHAESILSAVRAILGRPGRATFTRKDVRDEIGLDRDAWMAGDAAILQAIREDQPGGAPPIRQEFRGVFRRVGRGVYAPTDRGRRLLAGRR
jgi:hypothetical protein